ncbi:MAG: hypothetical protein KF736_07740 [Acidobacteria bacterium]|nr:hypothetical protein [Acidobacteriota bacterium]MCW5948988.1 hypothetical protein [Pyrinomonadaceae bacterium]
MNTIAPGSSAIRRYAFVAAAISVFTIIVLSAGCSSSSQSAANTAAGVAEPDPRMASIREAMPKVDKFFRPMQPPEKFDWLDSFKESGQTFDEYLAGDPVKATAERDKIYLLPLGRFTPRQLRVVDATTEYLSAFYGLPVKKLMIVPLEIPKTEPDARKLPGRDLTQIRTGYIMDKYLKPMLPDDAAALIALTNEDLYPGTSLYFVFGQGSMQDRVGVWSFYRLEMKVDDATLLRRVLKIASHEAGHMFSIKHCTKYECVMSGTNHVDETDRRPVDACPECMAKVVWATRGTPLERYERLATASTKLGLAKEADEFKAKAAALR